MSQAIRGAQRERTLEKKVYYSDHYFSLTQLCSLSQQIHEIFSLQPRSILEVGIGNGFTSSFLKRAGFEVVTADINPQLEPDVCAPLDQLGEHLSGRHFDLVVCCEVLEHMPFEQFAQSLDQLKSLGDRIFLTLPNYHATIGFGGFIRLPKIAPKLLEVAIDIPRRKKLDGEHFWEVGSSIKTSRNAILRELRTRYLSVSSKRLALNPYHLAFYGA